MISTITFEHGKTTCAAEVGKFCKFFGTKAFGTKPVCMLFGETPLFEHDTGDHTGWVARCHQCVTEFTGESNA